jgi:hypothetical protein
MHPQAPAGLILIQAGQRGAAVSLLIEPVTFQAG